MDVTYISHMGDDLMVVNAARVSFHKESLEFVDADRKLIHYLASHGHWTPFAHPTVCVRVKAPIFVARQLFKHKVGMVENEVSRRYVDEEPEFYYPENWRSRPTDGAKQGSGTEFITTMLFKGVVESWSGDVNEFFWSHMEASEALYRSMVDAGIAPEQCRMILPQNMYTEWYWTGSLASFARIYKLRTDPHAQKETQEVAEMIDGIVRPLFPVSWEALVEVQK